MSLESSDGSSWDDRPDRVAVHLVWDGVLLAGAVAAVLLVYTRSSAALSGDALRAQLVAAAASLLVASGFAVSLRAAVPNLAVGGIAASAGVLVGWLVARHNLSLGAAAGTAAVVGLGVGLLLGVAVVVLRAPAWAASLGAVALLSAGALSLAGGAPLLLQVNPPDLTRWAWLLFLGAVLVSAAGGAVALAPRPRARLGGYRPAGDPAAPRPRGGAVVAVGTLMLSSLLATAAGLVTVLRLREALPVDTSLTTITLPAVAAALLGGVSVHGRRGGVFGTALTVITIQSLLLWFGLGNFQPWVPLAVVGAAILLGLVVSRVVESMASPGEAEPVRAETPGPPPWSPPAFDTGYQPGYDAPYRPQSDTGYQPADTERT